MRAPGSGGPGGLGGGFGGGLPRLGPGLPLPPVVKQLLIANLAVFVLTRMIPGVEVERIEDLFGFVAADVLGRGRVWQFATYMFLHGGFFHILFNMMLLWMFGTTVEHRWGSRAFLTYYAVCGLGGAILSWVMGPSSTVPMIGASAAVLGVLLAYIATRFHLGELPWTKDTPFSSGDTDFLVPWYWVSVE